MLVKWLKKNADPCKVTDRVILISIARLLWCIHDFIEEIAPAY